jgi:hypothetical protein
MAMAMADQLAVSSASTLDHLLAVLGLALANQTAQLLVVALHKAAHALARALGLLGGTAGSAAVLSATSTTSSASSGASSASAGTSSASSGASSGTSSALVVVTERAAGLFQGSAHSLLARARTALAELSLQAADVGVVMTGSLVVVLAHGLLGMLELLLDTTSALSGLALAGLASQTADASQMTSVASNVLSGLVLSHVVVDSAADSLAAGMGLAALVLALQVGHSLAMTSMTSRAMASLRAGQTMSVAALAGLGLALAHLASQATVMTVVTSTLTAGHLSAVSADFARSM